MLCSEFGERLHDDDSRDALLGRTAMPTDIRAHLGECPECMAVWREAMADTRALSGALVLAPPDRVRAFLYEARPRYPRLSEWVDWAAATWSLVGGALGASFAGYVLLWPSSLQWMGFAVGAAAAAAGTTISRLDLSAVLVRPRRLLPGSLALRRYP